jgi:gamma-glutamylcyclotransferase (GGCT)/AIG2-like uncharacterized protein YtfP
VAPNVNRTPYLLVYGTLMRGLGEDWQHQLGARFIRRGSIKARLYDLAGYPGAVGSGSDERVKGELYRLTSPERALAALDDYEEYLPSKPLRSLFVREVLPVTLEGGGEKKAWVYLYNREVPESRVIPSGDYRRRLSRRQNRYAPGPTGPFPSRRQLI